MMIVISVDDEVMTDELHRRKVILGTSVHASKWYAWNFKYTSLYESCGVTKIWYQSYHGTYKVLLCIVIKFPLL